jgi:sodium transport system permease protein
MNWQNIRLIFWREVLDQLRDRRTLFMILILPILLYPALGIGMMQLSVLFSEQPRTVVILGAQSLPNPPLLEGDRFAPHWFRDPVDADKLRVITDASVASPTTAGNAPSSNAATPSTAAPAGNEPAVSTRAPSSAAENRDSSDAGLLEEARLLKSALKQRQTLETQLADAEKQGDLAGVALARDELASLQEQVTAAFAASRVQVLILVPDDFAQNLNRLKTEALARESQAVSFDYPRPLLVHNSADEKSLIASGRVERVLDAWEREILRQALEEAGLPASLPAPVKAAELDLAEAQQLSANVWSKIFPALLVIMALTGAFYPAIDLGAGEKERGTMETLLICPATRTEIVLGKFLTVMLFSASTALLNLSSLGFTGKYVISLAAGGPASRLGDLNLPPLPSLLWVLVMLIPLASLFSALCLAFATFARSSKEGQYYLTPLLMVTLGLTVFCLSPAVEMQPFYAVIPVMGPALLLKGLLLGTAQSTALLPYVVPVLVASLGCSVLALWWAIDQFGSEEVLFREAERFDLRLWIRHLLRDKEATPSFAEAVFCFVLLMFLQFAALKVMKSPLQHASEDERGMLMLQLLIIQQLVFVATPPMLMGVMLTTSLRDTFRLRWPGFSGCGIGLLLAVLLHPLSLELAAALSDFFPPLPQGIEAVLLALKNPNIPWWLPLLAFAVAPAVCEEIAFRGFLLSGFSRSGRTNLAIVLSALTFGIIHLIPQQVLNAALLGLVLGLIAVRTNSLYPGIVFHISYNGIETLRNRYGVSLLEQLGPWSQWFAVAGKEGVRYQPLLLVLCGMMAVAMLSWLVRRGHRDPLADWSPVSQSWSVKSSP